ncbi:NADPH-dependent oxidoreductase [Rhodohalobacter sp. SW132]|uniref:NADPH-dependent FMN reductase n=1 Tax=Rhodohalobacter sp. SW132 TaxID=2293433 RepID=UPI000E2267E5|nr:NAD(P)H-dependent oxidoreductase [Rhodohalobacter sp. SW132]REL33213.1 NADPH-dependent oxidoreductase [Rhodohalobacter sp. SW132]
MNKIHLLSSTDRPDSNALKVTNYVNGYLSEKTDTKVFSLEDYPFEDIVGGRYGDEIESVKKFNDRFLDTDGILFIVPEYNGGFPGVLKFFIDYLPFPDAMYKMPVSFIGEAAGTFGALRPVEHLQQILAYRKALIYTERMFISRVNDTFDTEDGLESDFLQGLLEDQLDGFIEFVGQIKS